MDNITIGNTSGTYIITAGDDSVIAVGNGDDTIDVSGGDDASITIGNGNDMLTATGGGEANDEIAVGNGNDTVSAGANSAIRAGNGNDMVTAGANSTISVGNGNDTVSVAANSTTALVPTLTTLVSFNGGNGLLPYAGLLADAAGDLFGTTVQGGASGGGTVFELVNNGGGSYTPTTLASFNGTDGAYPEGGLIADAAGDLFGTTYGGGASSGTVFELVNNGGGSYTLTTLVVFNYNGSNGAGPVSGLLADAAGDLFGTTAFGGAYGVGSVFEIAKTGGSYASTPTTLASFNGTDGKYPVANLIADPAGDLFGTTNNGGAYGDGTVFEIAKSGSSYAGLTTLVNFNFTNGFDPEGSLITDAAGDLFGTTYGGGASDEGTVFEIAKTGGSYASTPTTLASFNGTDGAGPQGGLIADAAGDLFGTTYGGGANSYGTVFELVNNGGGSYSLTTVFSFNGANGANPVAGLIADAAGDLFGTTYYGGANNDGTAFELSGTGFQVTPTTGATITVGNGNDTVSAGANDAITLGNGNDWVYAGASDLITLGNGNDTVAFGVSPSPATIGNETVNDFNPAHDVIGFNEALLANYMAVMGATTQVGSDTVIKIDTNESVTLTNVIASTLSSNNFHFS